MNLKRLTYLLFIGGLIAILSFSGCDELITEQNDIVVYDTSLGQACLECHNDEDNRFLRPKGQWMNSAHAIDTLLDLTVNLQGVDQSINECGPECHTHEGFLRVFDSLTVTTPTYSVIGCFTCHQPHTGEYGSWSDTTLRALGEFTFLANDSIFAMDNSNMCAHCHQAKTAGPSPAETGDILIDEDFGPHYSGQADLFAGKGGFRFGTTPVGNSHVQLFAAGGCLSCHFGTGQGYQFGEHTFRLEKIDGADTTDFFDNCVACHSVADNFYQIVEGGSSQIDNVATFMNDLEGLLKSRAYLDPTDPNGERFLIDSLIPADAARILYNYLLIKGDGSDGIHNPAYAELLLAESIQQFDLLPPDARFDADILAGCVPLTVTFADSSLGGGITGWKWEFGDGDSSLVQNPTHVYGARGNYSVTLTVTSLNGTNSETRSNYIHALAAIPEFAVDGELEGCTSLDVTFSSVLTQGDIIDYLWDFGDGGSSTEPHPTHTYAPTVSSRFDVTLTVTDSCGPQSITKPAYVSVALEIPTPDFTVVGDSTGQAPFTVEFSDLSTGLIDVYEWNFDDGTDNVFEQNPTHEFTGPGTYSVSLTVKNACGQDTKIKSGFITVTQ
jgi:PKD repeat protein